MLLLVTGALYIRRKPVAALVLALTALGTLAWAFWEVGGNFWGLVPRLAPFLVMGLVAGLIHPILTRGRYKAASFATAALFAVALAFGFAATLRPHGVTTATAKPQLDEVALQNDGSANWEFYGNDPEGTRYAPFDQINKENVKDLEVALGLCSGRAGRGRLGKPEHPQPDRRYGLYLFAHV